MSSHEIAEANVKLSYIKFEEGYSKIILYISSYFVFFNLR